MKGLIPIQAQGTEAAVCEDIARRQQIGIKKYGITVAENPLPLVDWLQHAYEEALDKAIYLKRAIEELRREWFPMEDAPKDGTHIRCRMKGGIIHEDVHYAQDLSGEIQPMFDGWFIPNDSGFREIDQPEAWQKIE